MNLPAAFTDSMHALLPAGEAGDFFSALREASPVSIRLNPRKPIEYSAAQDEVLWAEHGYYLPERPSFTLDPLFHAGAYYVQEASSMFIGSLVRSIFGKEKNLAVLDLCAAPGGKSTDLLSFLDGNGFLLANEVHNGRARILHENIVKWGFPNAAVSNSDPAAFGSLAGLFDLILIDAPCSGEGMFRKDPQSISEWSPRNTEMCAERQRKIISDVWDSLKPGGVMIYSTCTYNRKENEEIIRFANDNYEIENILPAEKGNFTGWGITCGEESGISTYRFYPHKTKGEGLFVSAFRKKERDTVTGAVHIPPRQKYPGRLKEGDPAYSFVKGGDTGLLKDENRIIAIPAEFTPLLGLLQKKLRVMHAGVTVAEIKGRDLVPSHELALSHILNRENFTTHEIDKFSALRFQKKEEVKIEGIKAGWVLLTHRGLPLGWVKNLGTRANNYYPKEWKIRMDISEA